MEVVVKNLNYKNRKAEIRKKFRKLYRVTNKQKKITPEIFYYDNGRVCENKKYKKSDITISVMLVNKDRKTTNYATYILANQNHKSIPSLLRKDFEDLENANEYFNELCNLIENSTDLDIISKCYNEKIKNIDKKLFSYKLGFLTQLF